MTDYSAGGAVPPVRQVPPVQPPATRKPRTGAAITALVLGIVAIAGSPLPILNNASAIIGIIGIIAIPFAIVGVFGFKRGTAITGGALAILALVITFTLQAKWTADLDEIGRNFESDMNDVQKSLDNLPPMPTMPPMPGQP